MVTNNILINTKRDGACIFLKANIASEVSIQNKKYYFVTLHHSASQNHGTF